MVTDDIGSDVLEGDSLRTYLEEKLGAVDSYQFEAIGEGKANETIGVSWGDRELVLRQPPAVKTAPGLLNDVLHEYSILAAIDDTWVPTPRTVCSCEDETVIGDEFYLMERVKGAAIREDVPPRFQTPSYGAQISEEIIDTLSKIHNLDHERLNIEEPTQSVRDDVAQLVELHAWAEERTEERRVVTRLHEVGDWLRENAPETTTHRLVHGDYKPDNLMFAPETPPRISAVLDWEMSTIGDPLSDLGWLLSYWHEEGDPSTITDGIRSEYSCHDLFNSVEKRQKSYSRFMDREGYLTRREMVNRYELQTGIEYSNDTFYRALGVYKLAVILEGFFRVYLEGSPSTKDGYQRTEVLVPTLSEKALQIIKGENTL